VIMAVIVIVMIVIDVGASANDTHGGVSL